MQKKMDKKKREKKEISYENLTDKLCTIEIMQNLVKLPTYLHRNERTKKIHTLTGIRNVCTYCCVLQRNNHFQSLFLFNDKSQL